MKTIKIIDLLNKRANGEEVPKKIRIEHWCYKFEWVEHLGNYYDKESDIDLTSAISMNEELNYKVYILDEEDEFEDIEELNKSDYQYSQCPSWEEKEKVITIMNNNFELHQKAIRDIIENQKKIIERLNNQDSN